jgi:hypothetical protein
MRDAQQFTPSSSPLALFCDGDEVGSLVQGGLS